MIPVEARNTSIHFTDGILTDIVFFVGDVIGLNSILVGTSRGPLTYAYFDDDFVDTSTTFTNGSIGVTLRGGGIDPPVMGVPEPTTLGLLGAGLLGLVFGRRRRAA